MLYDVAVSQLVSASRFVCFSLTWQNMEFFLTWLNRLGRFSVVFGFLA